MTTTTNNTFNTPATVATVDMVEAKARRAEAGLVFTNTRGQKLITLGQKDGGGFLAELLDAQGNGTGKIFHQGDWHQANGAGSGGSKAGLVTTTNTAVSTAATSTDPEIQALLAQLAEVKAKAVEKAAAEKLAKVEEAKVALKAKLMAQLEEAKARITNG